MSGIMFFFGAGLGNACGLPSTSDLSKEFKRYLKNQKEIDILKVYEDFEKSLQNGHTDIENIYTLVTDRKDKSYFKNISRSIYDDIFLELSYHFKFDGTFDQIQELIERFIDSRFWDTQYDFEALKQVMPPRFLEYNRDDITLVTTNYDLLIENYFVDNEIYKYLNVGLEMDRVFDASNFRKEGMIDYIKLHGSINLYRDSKGNVNHSSSQIKNGFRSEFGDVVENIYLKYPFDGYVKDDCDDVHTAMLFEFEERVQDCEFLIMIGTSMRDMTIVDILKDYILDKKIIIIGWKRAYIDIFPNIIKNENVLFFEEYLPDEDFKVVFDDFVKVHNGDMEMKELIAKHSSD
jgi:SIR2-like domain